MEIQLDDITFQVTIKKEKRKTVTLKILSSRELLLKAPHAFKNERLKELLIKKKKWILEHTAILEEGEAFAVQYKNGSKISYMGEEYTLRLICRPMKSQVVVTMTEDEIVMEMGDTSEENVRNYMLQWYKNQARREILGLIQKYQAYVDEEIGMVRIKSQRTRWGSCSELKNLNFNWHLILLPRRLMEYVVVHELCHLKELNHSRLFWESVKEILPDYMEREDELKRYVRVLMQS